MSTIALKNLPKHLAKFLFFCCIAVLIIGLAVADRLPQTLWVTNPKDVPLPTRIPLIARAENLLTAGGAQPEKEYNASIKLLGIIPIGQTKMEVAKEQTVLLGGYPFGIKILAQGVMIVGFQEVDTPTGSQNPAKAAGLKEGDVLLEVNGNPLSTNARLQELVEQSKGEPLSLLIRRQEKEIALSLTPVLDQDGRFRLGMWVRDSTAGLGTMTFYHPDTEMYGGLGHAVCDSDTSQIISLQSGEIVAAEILDIKKATAGTAGEIKGTLIDNLKVGSILKNCECGVYGSLYAPPAGQSQPVPVAPKQEVAQGPAKILSCVTGESRYYDCQVEKINLNHSTTQNLVIKITDPALLTATGGIVQGMSGSPIVQNGKLIGAVTHVFVNNPEKGYGIFAETMLEVAKTTAEQQPKQAS